ncbi:MAG: OB-fold nucleic acid binding domain-containing protein [Lachnospiraceae bacterium]|nr:OB-fold nucleic acid binding domain-containing protein [Lachnospiraceae bacterium]
MKNNLVVFWGIIAFCVCSLSLNVYAKDKTESVGNIDKTLYNNASVDLVCKEFKVNGYRASNKYKGKYYALAGVVESIDSTGKKLVLKTTESSNLYFECTCSSKNVKEGIGKLSANDKVIACGKVKKADEKVFEIAVDEIIAVSNPISQYDGGFTFSDGAVYLESDLAQFDIDETASIRLLKKWKDISKEEEWNKKMNDSFGTVPGSIYDLGNDEMFGIYSFSWEEIRKMAEKKKNGGKEWKVFVEDKVERFLLDTLSKGEFDYNFGIAKSVKNIKVIDKKYDYFYGIDNDKENHSEMFFIRSGENFLACVYDYGKDPKHCGEVAFVLSTMSVDQGSDKKK